MVAEVLERLSAGTLGKQKFDRGRFNLKKLKDAEVSEEYQVKISKRFAAFEN